MGGAELGMGTYEYELYEFENSPNEYEYDPYELISSVVGVGGAEGMVTGSIVGAGTGAGEGRNVGVTISSMDCAELGMGTYE